ncbi:MAG TPA: glucose-6-phosphate isomerase family protein [Conexivisphaerales archaeon]|nr:glucose-6-phosphate isomerase family protein [Conexivisphaerales archaeon]
MKKLGIAAMDVRCDLESGLLTVDGEAIRPGIRKLGDLKDVLFDRTALDSIGRETPVYYMYRDIRRARDQRLFDRHSLRFDMTVIPPRVIGKEYVKTAGHYHPLAEDSLSFPEVYQVLNGSANFLLQKMEEGTITDVVLVRAGSGEAVVIPPNYGHVTINRSRETLVLANLVSSRFESLYEPMRTTHGAAYYMLVGGRFVRNPAYVAPPPLRTARANRHALKTRKDIYSAFLERPNLFLFLNHPSEAPTEPFTETS